jgi:hypothetical protein
MYLCSDGEFMTLSRCNAAMQQCSNAAMQQCSNAAMQQCSNAAMLQCCNVCSNVYLARLASGLSAI